MNTNKLTSFININLVQLFLILITTLFLTSCKDEIVIDQFDSNAWKKDHIGCLGLREQLQDVLWSNKETLIGHSEEAIQALLGKPNIKELDSRMKKNAYYYIKNPKECPDDAASKEILIVVEYNSLNQVRFLNVTTH